MLKDFPIYPTLLLVFQVCLQAHTCEVAGMPLHRMQHSEALTEAMAVPALNKIDKDCAWYKFKGMCSSPSTAQ